jgi:hypothetical protein
MNLRISHKFTEGRQMKKFFNMIEVTLAIAVVGLGMAGIMALFPVGFQSSRDAIGDNYAADTAEQVLSYLASACQTNWTTMISSDGTAGTGSIPEGYASGTSVSSLPTSTDLWTQVFGNIFKVDLSTLDVFGIKQPATGNPDFTAHIKVWKSQITNMNIGGVSGISIPYYSNISGTTIGAARLNVEISWPVEKPYSAREKRFFCLEIFKQY